jgi:hypothetical protein
MLFFWLVCWLGSLQFASAFYETEGEYGGTFTLEGNFFPEDVDFGFLLSPAHHLQYRPCIDRQNGSYQVPAVICILFFVTGSVENPCC